LGRLERSGETASDEAGIPALGDGVLGEQALEITDMLVRSGAVDVVVDSVAALTAKAEIEGEMGDSHMGLQARLMSRALRKFRVSPESDSPGPVPASRVRELSLIPLISHGFAPTA